MSGVLDGRYDCGVIYWYKDGLLHREDGPAVEWQDGTKFWWINGVKYTKEEFEDYVVKKILKDCLIEDLVEKTDNKKMKL